MCWVVRVSKRLHVDFVLVAEPNAKRDDQGDDEQPRKPVHQAVTHDQFPLSL
jgi:hypothetical protein